MPAKKTSKKSVAKKDSHEAHIPDSIKKQGEAADELQDQIVNQAKGDPVDPKDDPIDSKDEPKAQTNDKPVNPPTDPAEEDWKHKYDVLKGKFDAQEASLRTELNGLRQLVETQQATIQAHADANKRLEEKGPAPGSDSKPPEIGIDGVDVDDYSGYGDEIVDLASKFNQVLELNKRLLSMVESGGGGGKSADADRLDRIEQQQRMTAQERYIRTLDAEVPNWRTLNESNEFGRWLNEPDPVSMYRRYDILKNAVDELRADHVVNIFKAFSRDTNADLGTMVESAREAQRHGNTNIIDETDADPLAQQMMPNENVGSTGEGQPQEKLPTKEEFNEAVTLYTKGKITVDDFNEISRGYHRRIAKETAQ